MKRFIEFLLILCAITDKMFENTFTIAGRLFLLYATLIMNIATGLIIIEIFFNFRFTRSDLVVIFYPIALVFFILTIMAERELKYRRNELLEKCKNIKKCKLMVIFYSFFSLVLLFVVLTIRNNLK